MPAVPVPAGSGEAARLRALHELQLLDTFPEEADHGLDVAQTERDLAFCAHAIVPPEPAGDLVLCELGRRLAAGVRGSDTVAHLRGDEFVVLLEGVARAYELEQLATKLVAAMRVPFSIGDVHIDGAALDGAACLALADHALDGAKRQGRNRYVRA